MIGTNGTDHVYPTLPFFIFNSLKYNIITKFTNSLARSKFHRTGLQGYDSTETIVSAQCDMTSFLAMTNNLTSSQCPTSASPVRFNPSKLAFQSPSRATSTLSVDFTHLETLLGHVHIRDTVDHRTIGLRRSNSKASRLLRLLASSCIINIRCGSVPNVQRTVDVDCVFPFQSITANYKQQIQSVLQSLYNTRESGTCHNGKPGGSDTVFYRFRENFDEAQGRYLSSWKAVSMVNNCFHSASTMVIEETASDDYAFSLEWSQIPPPASSTWTSDARYFGQFIMGQVECFFPTVTFFGDYTITEIEKLIESTLP